jgi:hypothetical protein
VPTEHYDQGRPRTRPRTFASDRVVREFIRVLCDHANSQEDVVRMIDDMSKIEGNCSWRQFCERLKSVVGNP